MNTHPEKLTRVKPTGKRYSSVDDMLKGIAADPQVVDGFKAAERESELVDLLVDIRRASGLTQEAMAAKLGVTQSAISKWESGSDEELTVKIVREYCKAAQQRVVLCFGKSLNHVEAVKEHALEIKRHLSALASLAQGDEELEGAIQGFFGEAFFNILSILARCQKELPNGKDFEVRVNVVKRNTSSKRRELAAPVPVKA